jgi:hypothetical protein
MKTLLRSCLVLAIAAGLVASAAHAEGPHAGGDHLELCQEEVPGTINPTASFPALTSPAYSPNGAFAVKSPAEDQRPSSENEQSAAKKNTQDDQPTSSDESTKNSASESDYEP